MLHSVWHLCGQQPVGLRERRLQAPGEYDRRKIKDGRTGSKYTLECKLEAVRLDKHGQSVPVTHYLLTIGTKVANN